MNKQTIYQGEDVALILQAKDDASNPADISGYDFELLVSTTAYGRKAVASTCDSNKIPIIRPDNYSLSVNLSHEVTAGFAPGQAALEVMKITNRGEVTEVREIAQAIALVVNESIIGQL